MKQHLTRAIALWVVLFLICFGLGYATLNRYSPAASPALSDTANYQELVVGNAAQLRGHWRYRVLVPYLARPIYEVARGRVGSWDPAFFSLLVVNSAFCAGAALLLVAAGRRIGRDATAPLLAAFLYLSNFAVINGHLAGLVDSAEAFFLLALIYVLCLDRWSLLLPIAFLGALAKETFVPLSTVFLAGWCVGEKSPTLKARRYVPWIVAFGALGLTTVCALQSFVRGEAVLPWDIALSERDNAGILQGLISCIGDRGFWYPFIWLLPLGVLGLKAVPRRWLFASAAAGLLALALGAWRHSGGNVSRAIFNCVGPMLSLSGAIWLTKGARSPSTG